MNSKTKSAFTLVELIVAVAILIILSTIWLVSYFKFIPWARDAGRIQNILNISEALENYKLNSNLPKPEKSIEIKQWTDILWWQGYMWTNQLANLWLNKDILDPEDEVHFSYYLLKNRKSYQLLSFLEEPTTHTSLNTYIPRTTSAIGDMYEFRIPYSYGGKLWIYLDELHNPIQEISDIITAWEFDLSNLGTARNYKSYISNTQIITWSWSDLIKTNPKYSCKRIKETKPNSNDGIYVIEPVLGEKINVYCDMTTSGWGWTLVHKTTDNADDLWGTLTDTEWTPIWDDDKEYRLSINYWQALSTTDAMAKNLRIDEVSWNDIQPGYLESISTSWVTFSTSDTYRIFGQANGTENLCTSWTPYWNSSCCSRCVNYNSPANYWFPSNAPMLRSAFTSYTGSAIEWVWGSDDANRHRLKKMWIFLR